jgi:hypothetical protein
MPAYLLLLIAILSRLLPHAGAWNFTAVGGALLFFGARRSWREMAIPVAALMGSDYLLTTYTYHYPFQWQAYLITWGWYAMAILLGRILLHARTSTVRVASGALLGPTSFFLVSNFAVWQGGWGYTHDLNGLFSCYVAALPFYRNDLLSTALVCGVAFGVPMFVHRWNEAQKQALIAGK